MKKVTHLQTKAWLLLGIRSLPGILKLTGGRLSFTALNSGNFTVKQLRRFELKSGCAGLTQTLQNEQSVAVFDAPFSEVRNVCFPWYYFGGGVKLTVHGMRYRFGFDKPANTKLQSEGADVLGEISKARRSGKAWKAALIA